jgi:chitin disaccharide deacetylase
MRRLIVNADDFGQSAGCNEGIIRCFERGVLTSASLMVRWRDAQAAAAYARIHPALSVGLHIDLGEWMYRAAEWVELYSVLPDEDPATIRAEVMRQLETFRTLMGSDPTHLDSHQHVHCSAPADRVVTELGAALGIPVRQRCDAVKYVGGFYGQGSSGEPLNDAISVEHLMSILRTLPAGTTELGCHPGSNRDTPGMYVVEREREVEVLCDPRVRATLQAEDIQLISFRDVTPGRKAAGFGEQRTV